MAEKKQARDKKLRDAIDDLLYDRQDIATNYQEICEALSKDFEGLTPDEVKRIISPEQAPIVVQRTGQEEDSITPYSIESTVNPSSLPVQAIGHSEEQIVAIQKKFSELKYEPREKGVSIFDRFEGNTIAEKKQRMIEHLTRIGRDDHFEKIPTQQGKKDHEGAKFTRNVLACLCNISYQIVTRWITFFDGSVVAEIHAYLYNSIDKNLYDGCNSVRVLVTTRETRGGISTTFREKDFARARSSALYYAVKQLYDSEINDTARDNYRDKHPYRGN